MRASAPSGAAASAPLVSNPGHAADAPTAHAQHNWQLAVSGFVQADAVLWSQASFDEISATGTLQNETRMLIRRARVRTTATRGPLSAQVEFDGNTIAGEARARLLSAQMRWQRGGDAETPRLRFTAGMFRVPFGAEVPSVERDKTLLEPPATSRAFFPGFYDAGVMANGAWQHMRWAIALVNGAPVADAQYAGRDPAKSFDVIARVGAEFALAAHTRLTVGASALTGKGFAAGSPATKDTLQWVDGNNDGIVQTTELQVIAGGPGTASATFGHAGAGLDVTLRWCLRGAGPGHAAAEYVIGHNLDRGIEYANPVEAGREFRERGDYLAMVQALRPWLIVAARYDRYQPDGDAAEQQGVTRVNTNPTYATLSGQVSVQWHTTRFALQYDHEQNPLGRAIDGTPTTRAADRLTLRAQVGF